MRFFPGTFDSEVLTDRNAPGNGISATAVRELLRQQNREALSAVMDERIIDEAMEMFHENIQELVALPDKSLRAQT